MLIINKDKLTAQQVKDIDELLEVLGDRPDQDKYRVLTALDEYQDAISFRDDSILDKVDEVVLRPDNQTRLKIAWNEYAVAKTAKSLLSRIMVDLEDEGVEIRQDTRGRPLAVVTVPVWDMADLMEADRKVESARQRIFRIWHDVIPIGLIPETEVDRLASGGTKGTRRKLPGWEFRDGKIVCKR